ncbi:AAA family ATPase [Meridianimarinicoccus roseus]|uniref:Nif-specific regulatory protein n=1 Tax=Meridianimarinicoccus roseus TaxID=2072018 RepID=A0A2V2LHG9_9RHOB|nr:sigma-54 dependent transcriptional regulator [Meridianimarinicoccus roseus]PWR02597.1 AAA family ATPase [Meridianimarinicoccus roseus]
MDAVQIIDQNFVAAAALADLLKRRRVAVAAPGAAGKIALLVCSAAYEASLGSPRALVEAARAAGAQRMIVVDEAAASLTLTEDLGGRLVRVGLPAARPGTDPLRDGALLALADIAGQSFGAMVAADAATGSLIDMAARVGRTDVTVFINGPTGSGKEVLARLIHASSRRAAAPFVAINCAAIPENMLEAILFGHEKGAFTGASTANKGIVRAADGGTLLLDEISEMPMGLQAKLLRVLQEKVVTPLGSQKEVPVDIRIVATSNRDMLGEVAAGRFREDLYYRLNVFPLCTQALADRPGDIPALAVAMIRRHCAQDEALPLLTADACDALMDHDWPGNVRELENVVQRALVLRIGDRITAEDVMIHAAAGLVPMNDAPARLQLAARVA